MSIFMLILACGAPVIAAAAMLAAIGLIAVTGYAVRLVWRGARELAALDREPDGGDQE